MRRNPHHHELIRLFSVYSARFRVRSLNGPGPGHPPDDDRIRDRHQLELCFSKQQEGKPGHPAADRHRGDHGDSGRPHVRGWDNRDGDVEVEQRTQAGEHRDRVADADRCLPEPHHDPVSHADLPANGNGGRGNGNEYRHHHGYRAGDQHRHESRHVNRGDAVDADADADERADSDAHGLQCPNPDGDVHVYGDAHVDGNRPSDVDTDCDAHADMDADRGPEPDLDPDDDPYPDPDLDRDPERNLDADRDSHRDRNANPNQCRDPDLHRYPDWIIPVGPRARGRGRLYR